MKIKHWQGYGSVTAVKKEKTKNNGMTTISIQVTGDHECGLIRNDKYDVYNWLLKKFDKSVESYRDIEFMNIKDLYTSPESVVYTITYRTPQTAI